MEYQRISTGQLLYSIIPNVSSKTIRIQKSVTNNKDWKIEILNRIESIRITRGIKNKNISDVITYINTMDLKSESEEYSL